MNRSAGQQVGHQLFARFSRAIGRVSFQLGKQPFHIQGKTRHQITGKPPALQEVSIDALGQLRIELVGSVETLPISRTGDFGQRLLERDSISPNCPAVVEQFERAQAFAAKLFLVPIVLIDGVRERGAQRVLGYLLEQRVVVDTLRDTR